jgi:hypothetical protein
MYFNKILILKQKTMSSITLTDRMIIFTNQSKLSVHLSFWVNNKTHQESITVSPDETVTFESITGSCSVDLFFRDDKNTKNYEWKDFWIKNNMPEDIYVLGEFSTNKYKSGEFSYMHSEYIGKLTSISRNDSGEFIFNTV